MKLALILNVIDPKIGGVMIMGDRGTGKSTTIRALADLLPEIGVVARDAFNSGASFLFVCWWWCGVWRWVRVCAGRRGRVFCGCL
jgi:energy-coupling factor transporter ATP-binding protein EcfA2